MSLAPSLASSTLFGLIDAGFLLVGESTLQGTLTQIDGIDDTTAELWTGGISAALAIFAASYLKQNVHNMFASNIVESPVVDAIGVIVGTAVVVAVYTLGKRVRGQHTHKKPE